ncbi:hypothetical protein Hanom_Chr06g00479611 [Helianthus anomalus]
MDGVNKVDENGMISSLWDPDAEKQTFGRKSKTGQTSRTKMTFYSNDEKEKVSMRKLTHKINDQAKALQSS